MSSNQQLKIWNDFSRWNFSKSWVVFKLHNNLWCLGVISADTVCCNFPCCFIQLYCCHQKMIGGGVIADIVEWRKENHLLLHTSETKEVVRDMTPTPTHRWTSRVQTLRWWTLSYIWVFISTTNWTVSKQNNKSVIPAPALFLFSFVKGFHVGFLFFKLKQNSKYG